MAPYSFRRRGDPVPDGIRDKEAWAEAREAELDAYDKAEQLGGSAHPDWPALEADMAEKSAKRTDLE